MTDLERAVKEMIEDVEPLVIEIPVRAYIISAGHLTVLSRIVLDGCTYDEAHER